MIKNKIKKFLERHPLAYTIALLIKYRKDEEYITLASGLRHNPNIVLLHEGVSKESNDEVVCIIQAGDRNDGFFASVRWALDGLYFCDKFGLVPYVKFPDDSLYKDESFPKEVNPFEYYFEQPRLKGEVQGSFIEYSNRNRLLAEKINGDMLYQVDGGYIDEMGKVMKKYLHFNSETKRMIDMELEKRQVGKELLGVHIRGTDYKDNYRYAPIYVGPEDYYAIIDETVEKYGFQGIYLATDDTEILEEFIEHYKDKILIRYASDITRGNTQQAAHTANDNNKPKHRYTLGLEVIYDMCALAECGGIISGMSQVGLNARIYKKSKDEKYIFDKIISKGVNKRGKYFSVS